MNGLLGSLTKTSPARMQTQGTINILQAMEQHGVSRLVSLTGAGVPDSRDVAPSLMGRFITFLLKRLQPEVLEDGIGHGQAIQASP